MSLNIIETVALMGEDDLLKFFDILSTITLTYS